MKTSGRKPLDGGLAALLIACSKQHRNSRFGKLLCNFESDAFVRTRDERDPVNSHENSLSELVQQRIA
jgi:hypothetical protein